jgi:hypothetical protein
MQRELDLAEVSKLAGRGMTKLAIAKKLGKDPKQIRRDWATCLARLNESRNNDTASVRDQLIDEARQVKEEAWEEWDRSKQERVRRMAETTSDGGGAEGEKKQKTSIVTEDRLAEPAYLNVILKANDQISELVGIKRLDARKDGHEVNTPLSDAERDAIRTAIYTRMGCLSSPPLGLPGSTNGVAGAEVISESQLRLAGGRNGAGRMAEGSAGIEFPDDDPEL